MKKFEEGVFSDLRNLKPGVDACLEEPKVGYCSFLCFPSFLWFLWGVLWSGFVWSVGLCVLSGTGGEYSWRALLYSLRGMVTWAVMCFMGCLGVRCGVHGYCVSLAGVWCSPVFSGNFSWTMDCLFCFYHFNFRSRGCQLVKVGSPTASSLDLSFLDHDN